MAGGSQGRVAPTKSAVPGRGLAGRFAGRVVSRVLGSAFQVITFVLVARGLGPTGFGHAASAMAACALALAVVGAGMLPYALRVGAYDDPRARALTAALLGTVSGFVAAAIVILSFWVAGDSRTELVAIAAVVVACDYGNDVVLAAWSALNRVHLASWVFVARRGLALVCVALGAWAGNVVAGWLGGAAITCGFTLLGVVTLRGSMWPVAESARNAKGFWFHSISTTLATADVLIVRAVTSVSTAGSFASAARLASPISIVPASVVTVAVPELVKARNEDAEERRVATMIMRVCGGYGLAVIVSSPVAGWVAPKVLGPAFADIFWLTVAFCVGSGLSSISQGYQARWLAAGWATRAALVVGIGTLTGSVFLLLLGSMAGSAGLALAVVGTQVVVLLAFVGLTRHWLRIQ